MEVQRDASAGRLRTTRSTMTSIPLEQLSRYAFPIVALVFVGLYLWGLISGALPELALARASVAGAGVALLLRFGLNMVETITLGLMVEEMAAAELATDVTADQS